MALFKKKKEDERAPVLPKLPELPSLPDFPRTDSQEIHQLPTFPTSSLGEKFSQDTIKEAISGKEEHFGLPEVEHSKPMDYPEEFHPQEMPTIEMPKLESVPEPAPTHSRTAEPIFIRIDKFEESLNIFNQAKEQISEIEHMLENTKELKQKEEEELNSWVEEIQKLKTQVEKVDRDIFSKVE
ncbi:hypothetical protein HOD29_00855 [archaeon]|nr:hypothetical protein [archaeon]